MFQIKVLSPLLLVFSLQACVAVAPGGQDLQAQSVQHDLGPRSTGQLGPRSTGDHTLGPRSTGPLRAIWDYFSQADPQAYTEPLRTRVQLNPMDFETHQLSFGIQMTLENGQIHELLREEMENGEYIYSPEDIQRIQAYFQRHAQDIVQVDFTLYSAQAGTAPPIPAYFKLDPFIDGSGYLDLYLPGTQERFIACLNQQLHKAEPELCMPSLLEKP